MNTTENSIMSCYRDVAEIDAERGVYLVQHQTSKAFYVKKILTVYNSDVYHYLEQHPIAHTPRILAMEEMDGFLVVIEEYCAGCTLQQILQTFDVLPEKHVLSIAVQLCSILQQLHECKPAIIHRDIKPSNIILSPDNIVYLLDMNAAKWQQDSQIRDTQLIGTSGYAAPEQYGFGASNVRTDLYAVGVLLNVLLTGSLPTEQLAKGRLRPIIEKCTQLDPSKRYASAKQLLAALNGTPTDSTVVDSWLPPGFRTHTPLYIILSTIGYIFILWFGLTLTSETSTPAEVWAMRISVTLALFVCVLFSCNYRGIRQPLHLERLPKRFLRVSIIVVIDSLILMAFMILAVSFFTLPI